MSLLLKRYMILLSIVLTVIAFGVLIAAEADFKDLKNATNIDQYEGVTISKIEVKGNVNITKEAIVNAFPIKVNSKFDKASINDALKILYNTQYFDKVAIDANTVQGSLVITIVVAERSIIKDIIFNGNKHITRTSLLETISPYVKIGERYTPQGLNNALNSIITNYQDKGFLKAYVSPKVTEDKEQSSVTIEMNIEEGNEVKVAKILFHGNNEYGSDELKRQMSTKENGFLSVGKFDSFKFEDDKDKILKYYKDRGYYMAAVDNVRFTYKWRNPSIRDQQDLIIDIYLTEGDKYYFGNIAFKGNFVIPSQTIQKDLRSKKGNIYNYTFHMMDLQGIQLKYSDRGYIFRQVIPVVSVDERLKTVSIMYDIVENDKAHIEKVTISGNTKTKDYVIERYIDIKTGEIFNSSKIQRVQERLNNTQFFENIGVGMKPGSAEGLIELNFNVQDGRTAQISGGGGFSTSSGFKIFADIKDINFLGRGQTIGLSGEFGQTQKRLGVNFAEPYLLKLPIYLGADISYFNENVNTGVEIGTDQFGAPKYAYYTRHGFEFILRLGYSFADFYSTFLTFNTLVQQYQQWHDQSATESGPSNLINDVSKYLTNRVNKKDGSFNRWESGWFPTYILSYSLYRDSRNDILNPTRGSYGRFSTDVYFGHTQLSRFSLTGFWAVPATKWLSFAFYGEFGQIMDSPFGKMKNDGDVLYYLNPFEDIRGWDSSLYTGFKVNRGISTYRIVDGVKADGTPFVSETSYGRAKVRLFAEARIPIIPRTLSFATFLDAGQLWLPRTAGIVGDTYHYPSQFMDVRDIVDPSRYMYSVGMGLRLTIPIFNIRFYVAKRFVYNKDDIGFGKGFQDFEHDSFTRLGKWLGRGWGFAFTMNHPFY